MLCSVIGNSYYIKSAPLSKAHTFVNVKKFEKKLIFFELHKIFNYVNRKFRVIKIIKEKTLKNKDFYFESIKIMLSSDS